MTAAFAREGDHACLLCADAAFSYFLVSGSLIPIEATSVHAAPSLPASAPLFPSSTSCSSYGAPTVEATAVTESKVGKASTRTDSPKGLKTRVFPRPVACEVEKPPGLPFCSWTCPYDANTIISGSALTPVQGNGGEKMDDGGDLGSAVSKSLFSVPMTTSAEASTSPSTPDVKTAPTSATNERTAAVERVEGCPLLPGQSLDSYLLHKLASATGEAGPDGGDYAEADRPEVVSAFLEGLNGDTTNPRRWRLEAQKRVCVGRVSLRFLKELEREEPRHDVEMKVAFLRRSEVSQENLTSHG